MEKDYLETRSKLKRFREIRENPHYNALQVKFAYAVTCHKAQGGQWKAVFVDRFLFGDEGMDPDRLRWLYTALTRATERLYLVSTSGFSREQSVRSSAAAERTGIGLPVVFGGKLDGRAAGEVRHACRCKRVVAAD